MKRFLIKLSLIFLLIGFPITKGYAQLTDGMTGLLHMVNAEVQKDGTFMLGGNLLHKYNIPNRVYWGGHYNTYNYYLNLTLFDRIEVSYICTLVQGIPNGFWPNFTYGKFVNQDRNFSGRLRLWKEGWWKWWTPQIVLGANDPGSFNSYGGGSISFDKSGDTSHHFNRYYIAATKHFDFAAIGRLGIHAAYCHSIKDASLRYTGPAVGANFRFNLLSDTFWAKALNGFDWMAEYDTRHVNVGFNYSLWKDHINLVAELNDGKYFSGGIFFEVHLK